MLGRARRAVWIARYWYLSRPTHPGWSGGGWRGAAGTRRHLPGSARAPVATGWTGRAAHSCAAASATLLCCGSLRQVQGPPQPALLRRCPLMRMPRGSSVCAGCGGCAKVAASSPCRVRWRRRRRQGQLQRVARRGAACQLLWSWWSAAAAQRRLSNSRPSRAAGCRAAVRAIGV